MKSPSWIKPLMLASVLLIIGNLAYWLEYKHKPKIEDEEKKAKQVFKIENLVINEVSVNGKNGLFKFVCNSKDLCKPGDQSSWTLIFPSKFKADDPNVNSFISALKNLSAKEFFDLTNDTEEKKVTLLKEYGLTPDVLKSDKTQKITITPKSDAGIALFFGGTHPIGGNFFTLLSQNNQVDKNKVIIVPSHFKSHLERDLTYWRNKKIFDLEPTNVVSFNFNGPKIKNISGSKKNGHWSISAPETGGKNVPGDIENIDNLIKTITSTAAKGFTSDDKDSAAAKKAISKAKNIYYIVLGAEAPKDPVTLKIFEIEKPTQLLYATVSNMNPLYELNSSTKSSLNKTITDFRLTKLITSVDRYLIKRIEVTGQPIGTQPLVILQDKEAVWKKQIIISDKASLVDIDQDKTQNFLDKISGNRIKNFLNGKNIPKGEERAITVFLGDEKDPKKRQLKFWGLGTKIYSKDANTKQAEVFELDPGMVKDLPFKNDFFDKKSEEKPKEKPERKKGKKNK